MSRFFHLLALPESLHFFFQLFLDYTVKCYEHFMKGGDTYEEFDAEVQSKLSKVFCFGFVCLI